MLQAFSPSNTLRLSFNEDLYNFGQFTQQPHLSASWSQAVPIPAVESQEIMLRRKEIDERKKLQNRERVRKFRKRKKDRLSELEKRHKVLVQDNIRLHHGEVSGNEKDQYDQVLEKAMKTFCSSATDDEAHSIWTSTARVVQPMGGKTAVGLDEIEEQQTEFRKLMHSSQLTEYNVQYLTLDHACVHWTLTGIFSNTLPDILTPFRSQLTGKSKSLKGFSYITFEQGKIAQDIRTLDLLNLLQQLF